MKRRSLLLSLAATSLLWGCGGETRLDFGKVEGAQPVPPVGRARLFFYRDASPYEGTQIREIFLNGQKIGMSYPNGVIYRDVPAGQYEITAYTQELYPNQFKTVLLRPQEIHYVKIESIKGWGEATSSDPIPRETWVVTLIDPAVGSRAIRPLWFYGGGLWTPGQ